MPDSLKHIQEKPFYQLLFGRTALPIITILGIALLYVILMSMINHSSWPFHIIIATAALVTVIFTFYHEVFVVL